MLVERDSDRLRLTVTDDGLGLDPTSVRRSGLANLRERAKSRGGDLQVEPADNGGTTLVWEVPLA